MLVNLNPSMKNSEENLHVLAFAALGTLTRLCSVFVWLTVSLAKSIKTSASQGAGHTTRSKPFALSNANQVRGTRSVQRIRNEE